MESFQVCFRAVAPIFFMMALGYLAQRIGTVRREDVPRLNKIGFRYFMPVTLFYNLYSSDVSQAIQPKLLLFALVGVLLAFSGSAAYVLLTEKDPQKQGVKIQGIFRSNFVLIGLPLASALVEGGDMGPVALLISVVVPIYNVLAVIALEVFQGKKPKIGQVLQNIAKNPLILGTVVGLLFLLLHIRLPVVLDSTARQIAPVSTVYMLFLLGAFFRFSGLLRYWRDLVEVCLGRLVIIPGVLLTAAYLLGIRGVGFAGFIGIFSSATAVGSFTMVQELGGNDELAGDIVVMTSAACIVTMFGWSLLFKLLGAF
ncbi:MAG: AEC family transporter [Ruminococcaceae bacterium]|jgi:hypothetical protein|nr:AEC family transporter [Oscillospiraceae bacterium]